MTDAVEPVLVAPRTAGAERGDRGEDDVGLDLPQAVEIQRERSEHFGREVGDDDVRGRHQLADDRAAVGGGRVERHRALVAVHHQEHRAHAIVTDRRNPAVLAAADPLDPDDVGAEVGQQGRTVWPGDVAAEVENPGPRENAAQRIATLTHRKRPLRSYRVSLDTQTSVL
jgi:hypothetical protein